MNPIKAWNQFLFGPISREPLGAFRIVFGLILLGYLALMTAEFDYWYTGAGFLQGTEAREAAGPLRFSPLNYTTNPVIARTFLGLTALFAVGFTVGWRTRVMSVLLYLGMLSLYHRNVTANGGPDAAAVPRHLLHDVLPERSGLFPRCAAQPEARDTGRAVDRTVGRSPAANATLSGLLPLLDIQMPGTRLAQRDDRALPPLQPRVRPVQPGMVGALPAVDQFVDAWRHPDRVCSRLLALVSTHSAVGNGLRVLASTSAFAPCSTCRCLARS